MIFQRGIDELDVLAELERRDQRTKLLLKLRGLLLPGFQKDVYDDRRPLIATLCPRRQGKTFAHCARLVRAAAMGGTGIYIAKTRRSAKDIAWKILKHQLDALELKYKPNLTDLVVHVAGGGTIQLYGADNTNFRDALRGQGVDVDEIVVDESGHFLTDLDSLVREVLMPCTADRGGSVLLTGTPYVIPRGMFYSATGGHPPEGWSVHKLNDPFYNPHTKKGIKRIFDQLKEEFGREWKELNWVKREWFAHWSYDPTKNVYKFDPARNLVSKAPEPVGVYRYLLGLDFAWTGNTGLALVLSHEGTTFIMESKSIANIGMDQADKLGPILSEYHNRYKGLTIVYDHAQQFIAEKLKQLNPQLRLVPATKTDKVQTIEFFNADLQSDPPRTYVVEGKNEALVAEWVNSEWKTNRHGEIVTSRPKEKMKHDASDAALYAWRESRHHKWREGPAREMPKSFMEQLREMGDKQLEAKLRRNRSGRGKGSGYYL